MKKQIRFLFVFSRSSFLKESIFLTNYSSYQDYEPKKVSYYQGVNNTLLNMVPKHVKRVLDIGCAEGNLGGSYQK